MLTRDAIFKRLETLEQERASNEVAWDALVGDEDIAYQEFEDRFGPRREFLEAQDQELEFLSKVQVIDGLPVYIDVQEFVTTVRSAESDPQVELSAMFNAAKGHSILALASGQQPYRFFRLHQEDSPTARAAAIKWVTLTQMPDLSDWIEVSAKDLITPVENTPAI